MLNIKITSRWKEILLALVIGLFVTPVYAHGKGTIVGQVVDTDGVPIAGVTVSAKNAPAVITNPGGMYTLSGVKQKSRVLVKFEKAGYAPTQGTASLVRKEQDEKDRDDDDIKDDSDDRKNDKDDRKDDQDNRHGKKKLSQVTLSKTMLRSGASQTLNSSIGGKLSEKGFKVTFPANSLTVSGDVDVVISPLDVSTSDIQAAPGDFSARTTSGLRVTLESFSMADFTLTQNGLPVNLKPGATAEIELLLPANTPLIPGLVKPLWYFNQTNGLWQEEGTGFVAPSTTTSGRLAIFATVKHFTYWNSDQTLNSTAVRGRVVDAKGLPLSGVAVEGFGVDYAGHSYAVATDGNGQYCILVRSSSTSSLTASLSLGGVVSSKSAPVLVTTGSAITTCAQGNAQVVPDITLVTKFSCISGDIRDTNNQPVVGAIVYSSTGGYSVTNANGLFQLQSLENTSVTVYAVGYPSQTIKTPPSGSPCAQVSIRPNVGGGVACVTGIVYTCNISSVQPGVVVTVMDGNGNAIAASNPSDVNGRYCIDGLPENRVMSFTANNAFPRGVLGDTGTGGGSCAANTCNSGPGIDIFCF